jgi:hypothetical protein
VILIARANSTRKWLDKLIMSLRQNCIQLSMTEQGVAAVGEWRSDLSTDLQRGWWSAMRPMPALNLSLETLPAKSLTPSSHS